MSEFFGIDVEEEIRDMQFVAFGHVESRLDAESSAPAVAPHDKKSYLPPASNGTERPDTMALKDDSSYCFVDVAC